MAPSTRAGVIAGVVVVAAAAPLLFLGPGTDLDAGFVISSGRSIMDGDYVASRPPGAPVHEAATGLLEAVGGTAAANAGSLVAAMVAVVALGRLLRREGVGRAGLVVAVVVANPFFLIAATSTVDFCWALALVLVAANLLRSDRPVLAGICAALAVGSRLGTALLVVALVVAEVAGADKGRSGRRHAALFVAVAGAGSTLVYFPSYLAAGSSLAFARNEFESSTPLVQLGRFLAKDLALVGVFAAAVLVVALPPLVRALRRWRTEWPVRFAATGLVLSQLLFLQFPWKLGHLLPSLVCLAVLLGVALDHRPRLLAAVVVAQLAYAAVNVQLVQPDTPNDATGGRLVFEPRWGALVHDIRCRADDPDAWEEGDDATLAVWNCAKPWS